MINETLLEILCAITWVIVGAVIGVVMASPDTGELARCKSMGGEYGGGKCYVMGAEK